MRSSAGVHADTDRPMQQHHDDQPQVCSEGAGDAPDERGDTAIHTHMNALIKTVQSTRGLPGIKELKPEQIYEMMGMGAAPSRRKPRVTDPPSA